MLVVCAHCGESIEKSVSHVNRARKAGLSLYCGRTCAGFGRRVEKTEAEKKEAKRLYDIEYRKKNFDRLKVEKADWHKKSYDPEKQKALNQARMPQHVEYCRRPEYRAKKQAYDKEHRAKRYYGEFWEAAVLCWNLEQEVRERASRVDIATVNGTLNKKQTRRREYESLNSNKS